MTPSSMSPLPDPRVAKGGIDQLVERRDDVGRRGRGGAEADPAERLVALEHAVDGRHVRQGRKPLFRRHAERPDAPALTCGNAVAVTSNITCTWPATRSVTAGVEPL